jgi:SAM-dependent methyltransferase
MNDPAEVRRIFVSGKTLWRAYMNATVQGLHLQSPVLDVGSGKLGTASYQRLIPDFAKLDVTSLDISPARQPDALADVQRSLPFKDGVFRTCLLFNVLEYLHDYETALQEIHRVLAVEGRLIIAVPFLSRVHSDKDAVRLTAYGLEHVLAKTGFGSIEVIPLGNGAFGAALEQIEFGIPRFLRGISFRLALALDGLAGRRSGGKYRNASDYPLGYVAMGKALSEFIRWK